MELLDISMTEKIQREKFVSDTEGDLIRDTEIGFPLEHLPEGIMSKIQDHLGDGGARVTVSAELVDSVQYGNKAGSFLSVSVQCNNNMDDISAVHQILSPYVRDVVASDVVEAKKMRDRMLSGYDPVEPIPTKEPKKSNSPPANKVVSKPKFRR